MGRHSSPRSSSSSNLGVWLIVAGAVILAALAAYLVWPTGGNDSAPANVSQSASANTAAQTASDSANAAPTTSYAATETTTTSASATSSAAATSESRTAATSSERADKGPDKADKANKATVSAADTLLLMDTSDAVGPIFAPVSNSVADTARALGADGHQVALWNFSSPLTPGVTQGWRSNTGFGGAEEAANTAVSFGTGGEPQSRSAVLAASRSAAEQAATSGAARVVVVTTGTAADMDEQRFTSRLKELQGDATLSVVHVGQGEVDPALKKTADYHTVVEDGTDAEALKKSLAKASGL